MSLEINNTVNGSTFNDDIFSDGVDYDVYSTERSLLSNILGYVLIIVALTKLLTAGLALASDIYLIVIISKFRNLRNRINNFIRQYAIFHLLYLVLANFLFISLELLEGGHYYNNYCFITSFDHLTLTLSFYVLLFMAIDWYISNCHPNIYNRYNKLFNYGVYILYAIALSKWIFTSTICFWHISNIRLHLELASFIVCIIIVIAITVLKRRKVLGPEAHNTEYALTIPRIVLLWSLAIFVARLIMTYVDELVNHNSIILDIFYYIAEGIFNTIPAIVVYQLARLNKNFKAAYLKCCKKKRVGDYDDDNLDTDSVNESPSNNVTYNRSSEVIDVCFYECD